MPGGAGSLAPGGTWPPGTCTWARIIVSKACAWAGSSRLAGCKPGGRRPWRKAAVGKAAESLRLASAKEVAGGKRKGGKGKGEPAWKSEDYKPDGQFGQTWGKGKPAGLAWDPG